MDRGVTILAGAGFLAYAGASLLWSTDPAWGAAFLASLLAGIGIAYLNPRVVWGTYLVGIVLSIFVSIIIDVVPYGPFGNPNYFGCAIALGLAAALAYDLAPWFSVPACLAGLAYCQSRTAVVGAGFVAVAVAWRRSRLLALVAGAGALAAVLWLTGGRGESIYQRLGIWEDTTVHLSLLGAGAGSFFHDYWDWPYHVNSFFARAPHAYNDVLELHYLFGLGTIPLWFFLSGALGEAGREARLIFYCYLGLSLTFFPLFIFPINTLLVATLARVVLLKEPSYGALETNRSPLYSGARY